MMPPHPNLSPAFPQMLSLAVAPRDALNRGRLAGAMKALMNKDPTISMREVDDGVVIGGVSELHLEIIVDRLKRTFHVEASLGRPEVGYIEVISRSAEANIKFTDPHASRYAHVMIRIEPLDRGKGYRFENAIVGGAVPEQYVGAVDRGIRAALERGVVAGYPIVDVRAILYDGSYHDRDSSDSAFTMAAAQAFQDAARRAGPIVLEPIMRVDASVPYQFVHAVARDLTSRGGRVGSAADADDYFTVTAFVPLAELFGFASSLRLIAAGTGSFEMHFVEYAPIRTPGDDDRAANVSAPLCPRPAPRTSSVAQPEPKPERDDDSL